MRLRLLTLNTWLVPIVSLDGKRRRERIVRMILTLKPDIVCLQEVWLKKDVQFLRKALPGYRCFVHNHWFFNKSGLVTFSRFPLQSLSFQAFPPVYTPWFEFVISKGVLKTMVQVDGRALDIWNIHLFDPTAGGLEKTMAQYKHIIRDMHGKNTLLVGDLNIVDTAAVIRHAKGCTLISSLKSTLSIHNKYNLYMKTRIHEQPIIKDELRDYMLATKKLRCTVVGKRVITKPVVSDHYALLVDVSI